MIRQLDDSLPIYPPPPDMIASERNLMTTNTQAFTRHEIASLLAHIIHRILLPPQNLPTPPQEGLASSPETLLSVSTTVNTPGEQGDQ